MKNWLMKRLIIICIVIYPMVTFVNLVFASDSLLNRKIQWPEWNLPDPFKTSDIRKDIIYPDWLLGLWQVESIDLNNPNLLPIIHLGRFRLDSQGRVLSDRAFNAESLGKELFGDQLISVIEDSISSNRQLTIFRDNQYLESSVISRRQETPSKNDFLTDEVLFQIFHSNGIPRINKVETLSQYYICLSDKEETDKLDKIFICGEQWQVKYSESNKNISSNHYRLFLKPL